VRSEGPTIAKAERHYEECQDWLEHKRREG
jgi:hypothetical protein